MTIIWGRCLKFTLYDIATDVSKQETRFTFAGLLTQAGTVGSP